MSDARAIAAVTATLQHVVRAGLAGVDAFVGAVPEVTALPPDRVTVGDAEKPVVNLFLHRVALNQGWNNLGARQRAPDGARVASPPLALDLHYLLSAYGAKERHAEILLGHAMLALHALPVLDGALVRTVIADAALKLAGCNLDAQPEAIRVAAAPMNTEEWSRIWSALQARARPSAAYVVTVALLEARRPARAALPVRERRIQLLASQAPRIESVAPGTAAVGDTLVVHGANFAGEGVRVRFNGVLSTPTVVEPGRLEVVVPAGVGSGLAPVQVVREVEFGTPADPHVGPESNVAAFVLVPTLVSVPGTMARGANVSLVVDPPVKAAQRVEVLLGEETVEAQPLPSGVASSSDVSIVVPAAATTGQRLVRVRVDGVSSLFETDGDPSSPTFGAWTGPLTEVV